MLTKLMQDVTDERSLREFNSAVFRDIYQLRLCSLKFDVETGNAGDYYCTVPFNGQINKFWVVVDAANTSGTELMTLKTGAGSTIGAITVTNPASAGDTFEDITLSNDNVEDGDVIYITTAGGADAGRAEVTILLERSL